MAKRKTSKADLKTGMVDLADSAAQGEVINPWSTTRADDVGDLKELTTPPIVKVADMPIGANIDGTIYSVVPSRDTKIKNPLILVKLTGSGHKVSVPGTAAIMSVLLPEYDEKADREEPETKCPYIGRRVVIEKAAIKQSAKWKADDGTARKFPVFNVFVKD